jgi:NO-binding membrane sensor protein with MHYT domain
MAPDQSPAILCVTKKIALGMAAAICSVHFVSMTAAFTHQLRRAGARYMTGCQQRCVAMPVISVWNKKTGTGNQT